MERNEVIVKKKIIEEQDWCVTIVGYKGIKSVMVRNTPVFKQILALLPVYVNAFLSGCSVGWLPNAIYFFTQTESEVSITITQCSMMASFTEMGKLVVALPGGVFADKFGRKKTLGVIGVLHFVSWVILSMYSNIYYIVVARFILGTCSGLLHSIGTITIAETVSSEVRGKFVATLQVALTLGILFEGLVSSAFSSYKVLVCSTMTLSSLYFLTTPWSNETPCYLISASKYKEAKEIYARLRPHLSQTQVDVEFEKMRFYIDEERRKRKTEEWSTFIRSKSIRRPLLTGMMMEFFVYSTGIFVLLNFISNVIPNNNYLSKKYYPMIMTSVAMLGNFGSICVLDMLPRRILYMSACMVCFTVQTSTAFFQYLYVEYRVSDGLWGILVGNLLVRVLWSVLLIPLQFTVKSEIFPQSVRGLGGSLCVMASSLSNILTYQLYDIVNFNMHYMYAFFAFANLTLFFIVYTRLPEGRGLCLEDIQMKSSNEKERF